MATVNSRDRQGGDPGNRQDERAGGPRSGEIQQRAQRVGMRQRRNNRAIEQALDAVSGLDDLGMPEPKPAD